MKNTFRFGILLAAIGLTASCGALFSPSDAMERIQKDSPSPGTETVSLKWSYSTFAPVDSSPAIAPDGTIYAVNSNDYIYLFNQNGSNQSGWNLNPCSNSSPLIAGDCAYVRTDSGVLYRVTKDSPTPVGPGGNVWNCGPAFNGSKGVLYLGNTLGTLRELDCSGNESKFKNVTYDSSEFFTAGPVIGSDGLVYLASSSSFYQEDFVSDQSVEYKNLGLNNITHIVPDTNGRLYVVSELGFSVITINNPTEAVVTNLLISVDISASPAIAADGTVYVCSTNGTLYSFGSDGSTNWTYQSGGGVYSSPAVGKDGTVFFGSLDGNFYAVKPDGTLKWKYPTGGAIYSSPVIGSDGTVYFGSRDCKLYALTTGCGGPADSPWPMYGHDARHTFSQL